MEGGERVWWWLEVDSTEIFSVPKVMIDMSSGQILTQMEFDLSIFVTIDTIYVLLPLAKSTAG